VPSPLNEVRTEILEQCLSGATQEPGFFSLTVPTGGGKTLASLGFGLSHALAHEKRRIIIVIPYTSIIEQTAEVLRGVLGEDAVLEHHSNLDPDSETQLSKLATENWDAPIIVTTNVQFFESLFAARTSACRKLHNIADSVVILDEAQMVPPEFLKPILSALDGLVTLFGASVVLCTATQPVLTGYIGPRARGKDGGFEGLRNVRELMKQPDLLACQLRRVSVTPRNLDRVTTWEEVAASLMKEPQVLCIVNTRRDCRELHALLPKETIHLSALMCGEHRSGVIRHIKSTLLRGEPIRVVSTQLVEAGVDIDFPVVFRAMAGIDSIAQAAGRCNREGRLPDGQLGRVVVFNSVRKAPPGLLRKGQDAGLELFRTKPGLATALTPEAFTTYFQGFFGRVSSFDVANVLDPLVTGERAFEFQFRTVASRFRLIDDGQQRPVVVWFEGRKFKSVDLINTLQRFGPTRKTMRRLQRFTVTIPERAWNDLVQQGAIEELQGPTGPLAIWAQALPGLYDDMFGLRLEGPAFTGDEFVC
jgi:CRISPR-associated endonuclease/helicase Cas3